jgi:hypothetical protein
VEVNLEIRWRCGERRGALEGGEDFWSGGGGRFSGAPPRFGVFALEF